MYNTQFILRLFKSQRMYYFLAVLLFYVCFLFWKPWSTSSQTKILWLISFIMVTLTTITSTLSSLILIVSEEPYSSIWNTSQSSWKNFFPEYIYRTSMKGPCLHVQITIYKCSNDLCIHTLEWKNVLNLFRREHCGLESYMQPLDLYS